MLKPDKLKFSAAARHALIDRQWTVQKLAVHIDRPQSTVSRAIHTTKFPLVRQQIINALALNPSQLIAD
jgi:hypothetical protein